MDEKNINYQKYYKEVKKDFEFLRQEYPYSTMFLPPTVQPRLVIIKVIAVHSEIINLSKAEPEDFLGEYSRELLLVVPWNYKEVGCKVYGGSWIQETKIHKLDRHFYGKESSGMREFCVGVPASFTALENVILENVKTAESMLVAYEQVQRGITIRANLIGYSHGERGEKEYERDSKKYKSNRE